MKKVWCIYILPILVIAAQNLSIFFDHYFQGITFQSDFIWGYMAMPSFIFQSIRQGVFPHWMPFQGLGYPTLINLQMGTFFPVYAVLGLIGLAPTPLVLTIMQCVHIFFGAVGMYFLARFYTKSTMLTLLAAMAFQFHGGFFSNSQHPDIIRSMSYIPWLLYITSFYRDKKLHIRKLYWLPLIVFFLVTGGYPGIVISSGLSVAVFVSVQLLTLYIDQKKKFTELFRRTLKVLILMGISSVLLAVVAIGPFLYMREYLTRSEVQNIRGYSSFEAKDVLGLVLNNSYVRNDPSMHSLYVGLPILLALIYLKKDVLRRELSVVVLGFFALVMAIGKNSPVWVGLSALFPIMRMSHYPISDYRLFFIVPLILLVVMGVHNWFTAYRVTTKKKATDWRVLLLALVMPVYLYWEFQVIQAMELRYVLFILMKDLVLFVCVMIMVSYPVRKSVAIAALIAFTIVSGYTFIFTYEHVTGRYHLWKLDWYLLEEKGREVESISKKAFGIESRPARVELKKLQEGSVDGYYQNKFMIDEIGNTILKSRIELLNTPEYYQYMVQQWTPLVLPCTDMSCNQPSIEVEESYFLDYEKEHSAEITQFAYGLNTVSYRVKSDEPFAFVENEVYMPGWKGFVEGREVDAQSVNDAFRAWSLPAGEYVFHTRYVTPYFRVFLTLSLLGGVLWVVAVLYSEWSRR